MRWQSYQDFCSWLAAVKDQALEGCVEGLGTNQVWRLHAHAVYKASGRLPNCLRLLSCNMQRTTFCQFRRDTSVSGIFARICTTWVVWLGRSNKASLVFQDLRQATSSSREACHKHIRAWTNIPTQPHANTIQCNACFQQASISRTSRSRSFAPVRTRPSCKARVMSPGMLHVPNISGSWSCGPCRAASSAFESPICWPPERARKHSRLDSVLKALIRLASTRH